MSAIAPRREWKPTDVEVVLKAISDAEAALERARETVADVADISDRIRSWLDREKTKFPGLTHAEVAVIERLIEDLS